ncbi:immunoglobulin domain-containing protein oig-4-like [Agrilus planipennis]|uniref:Immunoglobulin domain-containing protein oig-4-like n=1 Tax=Agrilus planipennis TaxID=224129 RepID=A0A1W4WGF5_AGRPL|nr:immunoglobulin domain-containing protein oig-4-like [Agrilus planipennis]
MKSRRILLVIVSFVLVCEIRNTLAARGHGHGRAGKLRGRGRDYQKVQTITQHKSLASENYYRHKDGAKIIEASHFELDYLLGRKISFYCSAQGIPRPEITWFKDGVELYAHKFFQVHEWTAGNDTIKSKMEIDPTTQQDAGYYECQANNQYSIDIRGFRTDFEQYY